MVCDVLEGTHEERTADTRRGVDVRPVVNMASVPPSFVSNMWLGVKMRSRSSKQVLGLVGRERKWRG